MTTVSWVVVRHGGQAYSGGMKRLLLLSSVLAVSVGVVLVFGGAWAGFFTYQNVSRENIVTPNDATVPNVRVRGPLTLHAQAEAIRMHVLRITGGKTYAEMSREDENRVLWVTATTLITALNLGIITYLFVGLIILFGLISIWIGIVFGALSKKY